MSLANGTRLRDCLCYGANAPTIPPFCLARRVGYKPPRGGHRSRLTFALTHLAAARKAGIRFAMKCLARPPLHKGARYGGDLPIFTALRHTPAHSNLADASKTIPPSRCASHLPLKREAWRRRNKGRSPSDSRNLSHVTGTINS